MYYTTRYLYSKYEYLVVLLVHRHTRVHTDLPIINTKATLRQLPFKTLRSVGSGIGNRKCKFSNSRSSVCELQYSHYQYRSYENGMGII